MNGGVQTDCEVPRVSFNGVVDSSRCSIGFGKETVIKNIIWTATLREEGEIPKRRRLEEDERISLRLEQNTHTPPVPESCICENPVMSLSPEANPPCFSSGSLTSATAFAIPGGVSKKELGNDSRHTEWQGRSREYMTYIHSK
jgi:hypothetical protein